MRNDKDTEEHVQYITMSKHATVKRDKELIGVTKEIIGNHWMRTKILRPRLLEASKRKGTSREMTREKWKTDLKGGLTQIQRMDNQSGRQRWSKARMPPERRQKRHTNAHVKGNKGRRTETKRWTQNELLFGEESPQEKTGGYKYRVDKVY